MSAPAQRALKRLLFQTLPPWEHVRSLLLFMELGKCLVITSAINGEGAATSKLRFAFIRKVIILKDGTKLFR